MKTILTALAKAGVDNGIQAAKGFLSKLAGPAVEEIGLLLQDRVKLYRLKNQLRILGKAQEMLKTARVKPSAVPLRTLLPLLEGAALEEDESLSLKWAALLANAASGASDIANHPSFPHILAEISPSEALLLDSLAAERKEVDWEAFREKIVRETSTTHEYINQCYGNLFRLGLCRIAQKRGRTRSVIEIGPFGQSFLRACAHTQR